MESPSRPDLDRVCSRIYEISTLPQVAARVMEVASDAKSGALELKEAMEIDAALSSRVLRCVNSSAYATSERIYQPSARGDVPGIQRGPQSGDDGQREQAVHR